MRLLIVAATAMEVGPLAAALGEAAPGSLECTRAYRYRGHNVDLLVSGVGMVATAAWCSRALARTKYDVALNVGVCGSFDPAFAPGAVAHVISDRMAELVAEDADRFLPIEKLNLLDRDGGPLARAELVN